MTERGIQRVKQKQPKRLFFLQKGWKMKLKALSHYNGDTDTRYGDCILLFNNKTAIIYDCGHQNHVEEIKRFLKMNPSITELVVIVSHNDGDHTDGIIELLEYLDYVRFSNVTVYSALYLKHAKKVLDI
jgi:metal-dependent hydrolase (beta-lactamase superfamily II)